MTAIEPTQTEAGALPKVRVDETLRTYPNFEVNRARTALVLDCSPTVVRRRILRCSIRSVRC